MASVNIAGPTEKIVIKGDDNGKTLSQAAFDKVVEEKTEEYRKNMKAKAKSKKARN